MLRSNLTLFRVKGTPVQLHWSVLLIAVFFGSSFAARYGAIGAVIGVIVFLGSILAHEIGHALVARRFGISTKSIQLWALGGVARLDRDAPTARAEGWIAAAGPLTSLAIGVVAIGAWLAATAAGVTAPLLGLVGWLGAVNLLLAVFNMLPGAPLDGGRVLRAWRWGRHGDRHLATREAANAGQAVGYSLAGIGVVLMLNGASGITLVLTGVFIALSAKAEAMASIVAERVAGVRVGDLTWFGVAQATNETDATTMLWQRSRLGGAGVVAIVGADGTLTGIVSEEQLLAIPEHERDDISMQSLMVPFADVASADPDEDLSLVLSRLNPAAPIVTVWREGRLLGVVPRKRLLAKLAKPAPEPSW